MFLDFPITSRLASLSYAIFTFASIVERRMLDTAETVGSTGSLKLCKILASYAARQKNKHTYL